MSFLSFCSLEQFPPIPSVESVSSSISYSCCRVSSRTGLPVSPRTVEAYLSGIASAFAPLVPLILDITNHPNVRKVLKGCKKPFSLPINQKEPLSVSDIIRVDTSANTSFDACLFCAMLSVGFHSLHRLGEINVPDNPALRDNRKVISRLLVLVSDSSSFIRYILPYHKGNPFFLGSTIIISTSHIQGACPVTTLLR